MKPSQILTTCLFIAFSVCLFGAWRLFSQFRTELNYSFQEEIVRSANYISATIRNPILTGNRKYAYDQIEQIAEKRKITFFTVDFSNELTSKKTGRRIEAADLAPPNNANFSLISKDVSLYEHPNKASTYIRTNLYFNAISQAEKIATVTIGFSKNSHLTRLNNARKLFLAVVIFLLFSFVFIYFLQRRLYKNYFSSLLGYFSRSSTGEDLNLPKQLEDFGGVANSIKEMSKKIVRFQELAVEKEKERATIQLAKQVSHDIRSPLSALDMAMYDLDGIPEDRRMLIQSASQRIRDIANNLLKEHKSNFDKNHQTTRVLLISGLIEEIVSEKRMEFRQNIHLNISSHFSSSSYGVFAHVNDSDLKSIISNLINNAAEAMKKKGSIGVALIRENESVKIHIEDTGVGIPKEILTKLGTQKISQGKLNSDSGTGIGVLNASAKLKEWSGQIRYKSELGVGTTATIYLPLAPTPDWFLPEITVCPDFEVVILDDDLSIHEVWKERFSKFKSVTLKHISHPDEMVNLPSIDRSLFLFDQELIGSTETGLSLISKYGLSSSNSVLVTSHHGESEIHEQVKKLNIKLLPKNLASIVPIVQK